MRRAGALFPSFVRRRRRLLQSVLFSTSRPGCATASSRSVSRAASIGLAAATAAATSIYHHQALAKEAPLANVVPKDVVLYQYEAYPFCNKGSKPNLADLAVFGVLRPVRYLRSGRDMVEHTRTGEWHIRMEGVVGESSRIKS